MRVEDVAKRMFSQKIAFLGSRGPLMGCHKGYEVRIWGSSGLRRLCSPRSFFPKD